MQDCTFRLHVLLPLVKEAADNENMYTHCRAVYGVRIHSKVLPASSHKFVKRSWPEEFASSLAQELVTRGHECCKSDSSLHSSVLAAVNLPPQLTELTLQNWTRFLARSDLKPIAFKLAHVTSRSGRRSQTRSLRTGVTGLQRIRCGP